MQVIRFDQFGVKDFCLQVSNQKYKIFQVIFLFSPLFIVSSVKNKQTVFLIKVKDKMATVKCQRMKQTSG